MPLIGCRVQIEGEGHGCAWRREGQGEGTSPVLGVSGLDDQVGDKSRRAIGSRLHERHVRSGERLGGKIKPGLSLPEVDADSQAE